MRPLHLRARNLRTWLDLDLDVPEGIAAVVGPNGAGKSTLVSVIDLALFGTGRELKRAKTRASADDTVEVALVFDHDGDRYRVRRSYSTKGAGKPRLDFERVEEVDVTGYQDAEPQFIEGVHPLTRETIAETQAAIEQLLGLTRQTFRASSFLAQGDGAAFTQADPRDRKAILLDALGVKLWDALKALAADRRKSAETRLTGSITTVELQEGQLAGRDAAFAEQLAAKMDRDPVAGAIFDLERGIAERRAEFEAAQEEAAERIRRLDRVESLKRERSTIEAQREQLVVAGRQTLAAERRRLDDLGAEAEREEEHLSRRTDAIADMRVAVAAELDDLVCPTCKRPLEGEALAQARKSIQARLRALDDEAGENLRRASAVAERLAGIRDEGLTLLRREQEPTANGEVEQLGERLAAIIEECQDAEQALAEFSGPDIDSLRRAITDAEARLAERRGQLERADARLVRATAAVDRLAEVERELKAEREVLAGIRDEVEGWKHAEQAYGRDGIPALILEAQAIPQLEAEANRVIEELGRPYRFELRTLRETQAGTVKEALDIVVTTETGEALYEDFSGGERTRLDLSLRIALARLLASRRGADVRLLVIDEPAFLDADGFEQLAKVLRGLREFESVLIVSHESALRDAFDTAISVAGGGDTGEPSRLEEVT